MNDAFGRKYRSALEAFLRQPGEEARQGAYELGREALRLKLGVVGLLQMHQEQTLTMPGADRDRSWEFLSEAAAPLEMELGGYQDTIQALKDLNRDLEARVASRTRRLEALAELGRKALEMDFADLCTEASLTLARELDTEFSKVLKLGEDGQTLTLAAGLGWSTAPGGAASTGFKAVAGQQNAFVLASPEAVAFSDLQNEERFRPGPLLSEHQIVSGLELRIPGPKGPWGILGVNSRKERRFSPGDQKFISAMADVLGSALRRLSAEQALAQSEERLHQSQKLEAMGRLAGGVAHDFNNLLTVINGYSELAMEKATDPALRQTLEDIRKAGGRAAQLTRQLLAFSHKQTLKLDSIDLNALVTDMEKMLKRLIPEDIHLQFTPGPGLGKVRADASQMEQVLMNLVLNAKDAMPSGGDLALSTRSELLESGGKIQMPDLAPGPYAVLKVQDNGIGMDARTRAQLFDPFFTTKAEQGHTGLGLATAYGIIKQNLGALNVMSEPGKGSAFEIWLPVVRDPLPQALTPVPSMPAKPANGWETILVVEDDPLVRRLTCGVLQGQGYHVLEADGPDQALAIADVLKDPVQLMVTDMVMPKLNGRQLAAQLEETLPRMRVLYLSGYPSDTLLPDGAGSGKLDFLAKPYAPSDLTRLVREILDRKDGKDKP